MVKLEVREVRMFSANEENDVASDLTELIDCNKRDLKCSVQSARKGAENGKLWDEEL